MQHELDMKRGRLLKWFGVDTVSDVEKNSNSIRLKAAVMAMRLLPDIQYMEAVKPEVHAFFPMVTYINYSSFIHVFSIEWVYRWSWSTNY